MTLVLDVPVSEGAGTTLVDRSGYGHHMTHNVDSTWGGCSRGPCITFEIASSDSCAVPTTKNIGGLDEITVLVWVSIGSGQPFARSAAQSGGTSQRSWEILVDDLDDSVQQIRLSDDGGTGAGHLKQFRGTQTAFDGTLHHVGFTFHGPTSTLELYVDGQVDGSPTKARDDSITSLFDTPAPVRLGGNGLTGAPAGLMGGQIAGARIWSRALSGPEVRAEYARQLVF